MTKCYYIACFALLFLFLEPSQAQGQLRKKLESARGAGGLKAGQSSDDDSDSKRNDFEGAVWEYKIIDQKEQDDAKKTRMTGRLRIKQSAVFAVGSIEMAQPEAELSPEEQADQLMGEFDRDDDQQLDTKELSSLLKSMRNGNVSLYSSGGSPSATVGGSRKTQGAESTDIKGDMKSLLSQRLQGAKEKDTGGGSRIGDFSKKSLKEGVFTFDQDDEYPLSGRAEVKPDTKKKGGVWFGHYDEYDNGKKKKRWRIEMRKIDE